MTYNQFCTFSYFYFLAICIGNLESVKIYYDSSRNNDVNKRLKGGNTPLHYGLLSHLIGVILFE